MVQYTPLLIRLHQLSIVFHLQQREHETDFAIDGRGFVFPDLVNALVLGTSSVVMKPNSQTICINTECQFHIGTAIQLKIKIPLKSLPYSYMQLNISPTWVENNNSFCFCEEADIIILGHLLWNFVGLSKCLPVYGECSLWKEAR